MKKLIEISDSLIERLESLKEKFNVKSLAPIIDIVLTIGLTHFEEFVNGNIYINPYPYYPWYPQPYTPNYDWNTGTITIQPYVCGSDWMAINVTGEQNVKR